MITPLDIENKEFKKVFRGYDIASVETYLDDILEEYERIYKQNTELKDKVEILSDHLRQYNTMEDTLKSTLIVAQTTAEEVTVAARHKGENIIDDAQLKAKDIINNAHKEVEDIKVEYETLRKEIYIFKTRYKSFIESQLLSLEDFYDDIDKNEKKKTEDKVALEENELEKIEEIEDIEDIHLGA